MSRLFFRAQRRFFVGQVVNLRPIGNRPAGSAYKGGQRQCCSLLAAMRSRLAICGELSIRLPVGALTCKTSPKPGNQTANLPHKSTD
jgi:hypothetical protein